MAQKILFIEDEADHIEMVKMRLEACGFEFISAKDGEEGLKKAASEKPDLVLLDIVIPKIDGFEVCRRLKSQPATRNTPVLVITASGLKDLEEKCLDIGADDIVRKPYNSSDLVSKIRGLLAKKGLKKDG